MTPCRYYSYVLCFAKNSCVQHLKLYSVAVPSFAYSFVPVFASGWRAVSVHALFLMYVLRFLAFLTVVFCSFGLGFFWFCLHWRTLRALYFCPVQVCRLLQFLALWMWYVHTFSLHQSTVRLSWTIGIVDHILEGSDCWRQCYLVDRKSTWYNNFAHCYCNWQNSYDSEWGQF